MAKVRGKTSFLCFLSYRYSQVIEGIPTFRESMAKVHVCNVIVLDNPSPFLNPFQFEITFECIEVRDRAAMIRDLQTKMVGTSVADPNPDPPDLYVLDLLDPDPLVTGMDSDPDPSIIKQK
jgi:hypothetical protein